ncbi:phosphomannomutase/phosphoglucomutase [Cellvibrio polysaccharolyticus]|uniref:phosphomannomutase n=1 Tax=Cellvibrio polysaccharolyticus TaxID=2082724 RepID=A0A928UYJ3_9GAMM|nr:phosphomannomutase/phosphoglucomutase [Cellvibrio polysaccharolyticus]MBE8715591.1 phosphomannomutase/phosphoglucomutase [Cellvibrio polysaccharolyticus]
MKKKPTLETAKSELPLSRSALKAKEQQKRQQAQRRQFLLTGLLVALLANAALGWYLYGRLVNDVEAERMLRMTEQETRNRTGAVTAYLQQLNATLQQEAARETLLPALQDGDVQQLTQLEQSIQHSFYKASKVRLTPTGTLQLDRDSETPVRFTELDIVRKAERRQAPAPELVRINNHWWLHIITPIPAAEGQEVAGTLMVTLDSGELFQLFSVGDNNLGETRLLQKIPAAPVQTLSTSGAAGDWESREYPIPDSYLSVKFTPSDQLFRIVREMPALWILIISLSTALSLALVLVASRRRLPIKNGAAAATPVPAENDPAEQPASAAAEYTPTGVYSSQDILDISVIEEDADVLGLHQSVGKKAAVAPVDQPPANIFRSYDIRGVVGESLDGNLAEKIGRALGSEAIDQQETAVIVARDGRLHSEELTERLIKGINASGCQVIDIGVVPTPVLYFATCHLPETSSGVMVTASHNPAEYNGFKMVVKGVTLADDAVMNIRTRIIQQQYHQGTGGIEYRQMVPAYIERIFSDVALAGQISIVVDAGNAVTGVVAPQLFEELGCEVTPLFCDLDGSFPNHDPDPCHEKNLKALKAKVQEVNADIGVAFDGDGDRLVVVTPSGKTIWPDQLLMLFARDILSRHPGADVLFDVKCTRQLNQVVSSYGGRPVMWKTGHSPMKAKMIETGALLGGEYSGHIFIKDRWYGFDDGMYAMARLLEIVTLRDQSIDDVFEAFPILPSTPEFKIAIPDEEKAALIERLIAQGDFAGGKQTTIDGLRVDFSKGWGLIRASNTSPALTLRFEAEDEALLEKIQALFKRELQKIAPQLVIDF